MLNEGRATREQIVNCVGSGKWEGGVREWNTVSLVFVDTLLSGYDGYWVFSLLSEDEAVSSGGTLVGDGSYSS